MWHAPCYTIRSLLVLVVLEPMLQTLYKELRVTALPRTSLYRWWWCHGCKNTQVAHLTKLEELVFCVKSSPTTYGWTIPRKREKLGNMFAIHIWFHTSVVEGHGQTTFCHTWSLGHVLEHAKFSSTQDLHQSHGQERWACMATTSHARSLLSLCLAN